MNFNCYVKYFIFLLSIVNSLQNKEECNEDMDYVSQALFKYKEKHPTPDLLTTSAGKPIDEDETCTLNSPLLLNPFYLESIQSSVSERIPARLVFAKGVGAHGYFVVTEDVTKYTSAKLFESIGKKTPVIARFAESQSERDSSDLGTASSKGMAVKFYTEEGNFDLLGINTPVYFYRDPILATAFFHSFGRNPKTNIRDQTAAVDFIVSNPIVLETILWAASSKGLPKGYRYMNAFPIHTYECYNAEGKSYFVKFRFITELGYDSFTLREASLITSFDPDFFSRDLYNAIEAKRYPTWRLEMDVLLCDPLKCDFDPFDVTKLWPNSTYETVCIGKVVLNKTVKNTDAEVEKVAYNPTNLVPGILSPLDQVYKKRVIAYNDAQIHRLEINRNKIDANRPIYASTYNRDGEPPTKDNSKDAPNYYPNSFNGPEAYKDDIKPRFNERLKIKEKNNVDFKGAKHLYKEVLNTEEEKQYLVDNLIHSSFRVRPSLAETFAKLCDKVDTDLGSRVRAAFATALQTLKFPNTVKDINSETLDPYGYFNKKSC